jgi:formylglycine-generating enzyme required for sulfatase activity
MSQPDAQDQSDLQAENERLKAELAALKQQNAHAKDGSAVAQGDGSTALAENAALIQTEGGSAVAGDVNAEQDAVMGNKITAKTVIVSPEGTKVFVGEQPIEITAVDRESILAKYLTHLIVRNRYLQLQGIRSGGKLVNIELEEIYITLRASQQRSVAAHESWLATEAALAPGERHKIAREQGMMTETVQVKIDQALGTHRHLVILGDPGSGKTTLMRYLTLQYANDLAQKLGTVRKRLGLNESGYLPILLTLRRVGAFLRHHRPQDDGTDGHALLLEYICTAYRNERIPLPDDFFDKWLESGRTVIFLDGLDEVADPDLRRRVSRLVEAFTLAYSDCRFVVTSRVVGYTGAARLGGDYAIATVRDFSLQDVENFLTHWHRLVAVGQMGAAQSALHYATEQTDQLMAAIRGNERIRDLAINPLMLTVIALVHRDRVKLPDRRAELYAEAVDVLLGKWDEARGVREIAVFDDMPFDTGDKRLMLQAVALYMQENEQKEIAAEDLRRLLAEIFAEMLTDKRGVRKAVERFQRIIEERTGLLVARGEGIYAFSHLTFQEYLAAIAIAARDDYVTYTLARCGEGWWREVTLLEAGFLSMQSKQRTTRLIKTIAEKKDEPVPYHNLVLAAECLRDVGGNRVSGNLEQWVISELRNELDAPPPLLARILKRYGPKSWLERRSAALQALARAGGGYWSAPYGEPEWITIPAGKFWMGGDGKYDGKPVHQVNLPSFQISRVPITNAQYALFVKATQREAPSDWDENRPPKDKESHPVVRVTWYDAIAYCEWLGKVSGKKITLPSEAEWEKAARGEKDQRAYPWGQNFETTRCNTFELGLGDTTPVGIFLEGASPYGVLDLSGNVWEWTRSIRQNYPYDPNDGRENLESSGSRVVRGGAFYDDSHDARCACRDINDPQFRLSSLGFRVVVVSSFSHSS